MRRRKTSGFTLIEVLVAILIVATVMIVLIYRRLEVVQDAAKIRDRRVAWTLASLKLGDMARDPSTILDAESGSFGDDSAEFENFQWSYQATWEPVVLEGAGEEKPRSVRRVKLVILGAEEEELQSIEAMFQDTREAEPAPEAPSAGNNENP
jgi:prepilin-type N-terminal cleavage/methylation domain-containing protein